MQCWTWCPNDGDTPRTVLLPVSTTCVLLQYPFASLEKSEYVSVHLATTFQPLRPRQRRHRDADRRRDNDGTHAAAAAGPRRATHLERQRTISLHDTTNERRRNQVLELSELVYEQDGETLFKK